MKLTICVFLAFACLALTYAYPAEELVVDVAQDDVAPVFDDTDGLEDVAGDALVREKRQHHHHHHGGYGRGYGGYGGGYGGYGGGRGYGGYGGYGGGYGGYGGGGFGGLGGFGYGR